MSGVASVLATMFVAVFATSALASAGMKSPIPDPAGDVVPSGSLALPLADGTTQYAVGFSGTPPFSPGDEFHGSTILDVNKDINFATVRVHDPVSFAAGMVTDHRILYVEPDLPIGHSSFVPNDPQYTNQYNLKPTTTDAQTAWDQTLGSTSVKLCITDSGVDATHPDLAGANFYYWKDEVNGMTSPYDDLGHGTHVAGIIGAVINNSMGIAGAAQVSLGIVKVLNAANTWTPTRLANGVIDCKNSGAHIINIALTTTVNSTTVLTAVNSAYKAGILVVASAGNLPSCPSICFPAAYPETVAVTCSDAQNAFCSFSAQGPQAFVMAPGDQIISLKANGTSLPGCEVVDTIYRKCSGTSMSAAHVSAEAALIKSINPTWDRVFLKGQIGCTAVPQPGIPTDRQGKGLINYGKAVLPQCVIGPIHVIIAGNPPAGAQVDIYDPAGSIIYSATTDANGNVPGTGPALAPGTYTLVATYSTCNPETGEGAIYRFSGTYTLPPSVSPTVQPTWFHMCPTVPPP